MGLITNGHRNGFSPFRWMSGNLLSIQNGGPALRNWYLPGKIHNWSWHAERQTALPNGNLNPYCWMLPRTGGAMSMRTEGSGSITSNLIPTLNGSIDFTGSGDLTAEAALVISMFCDMVGSGTLEANISGLLDMSIDLEGDGDLAASMNGIASMLANLTGTGDLDAIIAAYGNMTIDIVVTGTGLTVEAIRDAIWSDNINYGSGTKGQLLEDAAAGGGGGGGGIVLNSGTIVASTLWQTSIKADSSSDNNVYVGCKLIITTGPGAGQFRVIKNYNGASKVCFIEPPWIVVPTSSSDYSIIP